ncbi:MAG: CehA/McbA family metallohydrolase [candidate division WS1 bacterium]|jgi:hypothetical protein|nr:CehA/McbA family metallohydrolase [candidate division WS1 bacterium]
MMSPHRPLAIRIVAPSTVAAGEEFALGIKALCEPWEVPAQCFEQRLPALVSRFNHSPRGIHYMDNAAERWQGVLEVEGPDGPSQIQISGLPGTFEGDERAIGRVGGFSFRRAGVHTIRLRDAATGIEGVSNPVIVSDGPPAERLWWGDLHSQTFFSDGLRCPEELYHFARHEAFLDIFAMADHSESLTDRQWEYFCAVTNDSYDPGAFATLIGFEWTNHWPGHRNCYYRGDSGPIVRRGERSVDDLQRLYDVAHEHGALLIPHHPANVTMGVEWEAAHDPEHERLVEIHSIWGNSERSEAAGNPFPIRSAKGEQAGRHVTDALKLGYRLGFVGGGDIHDGRPGDELHSRQAPPPDHYHLLHRQGIMGVWAPELTREAIFDALWNRRCFATMNVRMPIRFGVCGRFMGGEVNCADERAIELFAASEVPIARATIVRNGEDWRTMEPGEQVVDWRLEDAASPAPSYYYARVERADGWLAWSSPVWVNG